MGTSIKSLSMAYSTLALSQMGSMIILLAMVAATEKFAKGNKKLAAIIGGVAGAFLGAAMAIQLYNAGVFSAFSGPAGFLLMAGLIAATTLAFAALNVKMQEMMQPPKIDYSMYDLGGTIPLYDNGGQAGLGARHQTVMVEPGETIVPKTQNMLSGGGGITLNIQGDINTNDAEDFAARVGDALPQALRHAQTNGDFG